MFDLRTGKLTQLIDSATSYVLWSPSGDRLLSAYASNRSTRIVTRQVSDSARPVHLMTVPGSHLVTEWLRGDTLISIAGGSSADVAILTVQDSMRPKPYLQAPWPETQPRIAPDHRYAVHMALADGKITIYLREFPVPVGKWKVTDSGMDARWSPDGRALYYWGRSLAGPSRSLYKVAINGNTVSMDTPRLVGSYAVGSNPAYDIHPDGKRFVMGVQVGVSANSTAETHHVIVNFVQEVNRLLVLKAKESKATEKR